MKTMTLLGVCFLVASSASVARAAGMTDTHPSVPAPSSADSDGTALTAVGSGLLAGAGVLAALNAWAWYSPHSYDDWSCRGIRGPCIDLGPVLLFNVAGTALAATGGGLLTAGLRRGISEDEVGSSWPWHYWLGFVPSVVHTAMVFSSADVSNGESIVLGAAVGATVVTFLGSALLSQL